MNRFIRRMILVVGAIFLFGAVSAPSVAWALPPKKKGEKEEPKKDYTLPYFFTVVGAAGVIVPICWPTGRKSDIQKSDDDD